LRLMCHILLGNDVTKSDRTRLSLFYRENVEPERSIFSFFARSRIYSSQFKTLLSYNAYSVLCQNLQAVRCRIEHEKTLSALNYKIREQFHPKLFKLKRSKYNMVDLVMHVSALIGINQEIDSMNNSDLSGTEMIEFIKFGSYSGCTANVWHKMFSLYMSDSDMEREDLDE
jgi:hypothetical protein